MSDRQRAPAIAVLLCLFWLWVYGLTHLKGAPIGNDEVNTLARIHHLSQDEPYTLAETLHNLATFSPDHGPLYFLLMNLWQRVAGADLFVMRLPSTFFALLALALVYRVAALGGRPRGGLSAVVLLAFMAFFVHYAHIARMYTLLALMAGAVIWAYWRASHRPPAAHRGSWLLLFVSSALITFIHYAGAFLLAAIGLYHLLFARGRPRWWRITALMCLAGLSFIFWLPVAIDGMASSSVLSQTRLSVLAALGAGSSVFANGIALLPLLAAALVLRYRARLNPAQRFVLLVLIIASALLLAANAFTPILVEKRLRYLTILALPASLALAFAAELLPARRWLRPALCCLWIAASFAFANSAAFDVYTNRRALREDQLVHYQAFHYDLRGTPASQQLIMSFHESAPAVWKSLEYYRAILDDWAGIAHVTYDERGEALLQSSIPPTMTLESIASDFDAVWAIHNPAQTDLQAMDVYRAWFLEHYKPCARLIDQPHNRIELYVKRAIPCDLLAPANPLAIRYDNGMQLANLIVEERPDALVAHFWWAEILPGDYSISLQLFDQQGERALNQDALIIRAPYASAALDFATLPPGDYALKLIVYAFDTGASQPGLLTESNKRFQREVDIARVRVDG